MERQEKQQQQTNNYKKKEENTSRCEGQPSVPWRGSFDHIKHTHTHTTIVRAGTPEESQLGHLLLRANTSHRGV